MVGSREGAPSHGISSVMSGAERATGHALVIESALESGMCGQQEGGGSGAPTVAIGDGARQENSSGADVTAGGGERGGWESGAGSRDAGEGCAGLGDEGSGQGVALGGRTAHAVPCCAVLCHAMPCPAMLFDPRKWSPTHQSQLSRMLPLTVTMSISLA